MPKNVVIWTLIPAVVIGLSGCGDSGGNKAEVPKDLNQPLPPPPVGAGGGVGAKAKGNPGVAEK